MNNSDWKNTAEMIGIAAIVASLVFVGLELKQSRDLAIATAKDSTVSGYRELNFARMNADWYWEIVAKLNKEMGASGAAVLGIPIATPKKWREVLTVLTPEELGRFHSFHLQERNESERLYELHQLGLMSGDEDGMFLVRIRAPLWSALFRLNEEGEFNRLILDELEKYAE